MFSVFEFQLNYASLLLFLVLHDWSCFHSWFAVSQHYKLSCRIFWTKHITIMQQLIKTWYIKTPHYAPLTHKSKVMHVKRGNLVQKTKIHQEQSSSLFSLYSYAPDANFKKNPFEYICVKVIRKRKQVLNESKRA